MKPEAHLVTTLAAVVFAITHLGLAVLSATVTSRAASGRLARNQWIGIRTPSTMRGDQAWMVGHRAARRLTPLYVLNAVAASAVLSLGVVQSWSTGVVMLAGITAFVAFVVIGVCAAIVAGRAAKSARDDDVDRSTS